MSEFRFKQFSVKNEASAMKVGTDAVLLGAAMTLRPSDRSLLDVGTGTGVIALMAAQRLAALRTVTNATPLPADASPAAAEPGATAFQIEAIDIDQASASEAAENFAVSPWSTHLRARCTPLSAYRLVDTPADSADRPGEPTSFPYAPTNSHCTALSASHAAATNHHTEPAEPVSFPFACSSLLSASHAAPIAPDGFDLIFSNPPYYDSSLKNPDARESAARHTETLSYRELCAFADSHLKPEGRLSLILPADCEKDLLRTAASFGLYPFRLLRIRTTPAKPVSRLIAEFGRTRTELPCLAGPHPSASELRCSAAPHTSATELTLMDPAGSRSPEYTTLTEEFYL